VAADSTVAARWATTEKRQQGMQEDDCLEAYRCKARARVVSDAVVGLRRVLRRVATMVKIATTALLSMLSIDHVGLGGTPPAIVDQGGEHEKEGEDWRVKRGNGSARF
jgi:hypothetical protein